MLCFALVLGACARFALPSTDPTRSKHLHQVPAGAAPTTEPTDPALARVEPGRWDEWTDAKLVLALHEPIFYSATEDEQHARLLAFADGRVLYRVEDGDGISQWYLANIGAAEVEALRRSTAHDLAGTPRRFSCRHATHQRRSVILVRHGLRWRVREGYALSACLDDVAPDVIPSSSHVDPLPPGDSPPVGFVTAYRRLRSFDAPTKRPWHTPKLWLVWMRDVGDYSEERRGGPWPAELPAPPTLPESFVYGDPPLLQPVDGAFDRRMQRLLPQAGLFELQDQRWMVEVYRQQPGDDALACAWSRPWRYCGRRLRRLAR